MLGEDWDRDYPTVGVGRVLEYVEEQMAILFWQQAMEPKHIGEFIIKQQS